MRIAVTGNIGSGKSTFCKLLAQHFKHYSLVSVDELVANSYADEQFKSELIKEFGTHERKAISNAAFGDSQFKERLEGFFRARISAQIEKALCEENVFVEFPTLFEQPLWANRFDATIAVVASLDTRKKRVLERDGISAEKFEQISATQLSDESKAALADVVVDTERMDEGEQKKFIATQVQHWLTGLERTRALEHSNTHPWHALRMELYQRAASFFNSYSIAGKLIRAYSEGHRHYHALTHLKQLLGELDRIAKNNESGCEDLKAIEAAIWFHDYVYSVNQLDYPDNERKSAQAWMKAATGELAYGWGEAPNYQAQTLLVFELILATKSHQISSPFLLLDEKRCASAKLFLDIDLSVLAQDRVLFEQYDREIALEWAQDPESLSEPFRAGRLKAMQHFTQREKLFFSAHYQPMESQARSNLAYLIEKLGSKH